MGYIGMYVGSFKDHICSRMAVGIHVCGICLRCIDFLSVHIGSSNLTLSHASSGRELRGWGGSRLLLIRDSGLCKRWLFGLHS